ncbi:LacI family DNA-binding transcriptional regulator [Jeotgalibacillus haloalkalitolerans]|uniref:LacI family DNA-binding transcriptional regulator n=1 Tax=Jeotgalibacillus haloalkalitolerans TaxID=3104292 RepID=A0ABU5KKM6_9BACL|nr:LacI family DNA-binding transcriptional regulator [Jeotgalibacillus sp. HH7-29]MDZ5711801.1 LacI family DNA-binding transcriptional regulator [Jeotgalibacillus sp. HH7-29]
MTVTIKDIAREANVSFSTVSKALNDSPLVKEPTKQRILALAKEMGYEINTSAKILATGKSNAVGIYCPEITDQQYAVYVLEVSRELRQRGFLPCISSSSYDDAKEMFSRLKVACVIVADDQEIQFPNTDFVYHPFSGNADDQEKNHYTLKRDAALKAASLLNHSGHRTALILSEFHSDWLYRTLKRDSEFNTINHLQVNNNDIDRLYTSLKNTLDQTIPDAIICSSRNLAELTFVVGKSLGLKIPEDCSVIAFDGNVSSDSPVSLFGYSSKKMAAATADYVYAVINKREYHYVNLNPEMTLNYTVKL